MVRSAPLRESRTTAAFGAWPSFETPRNRPAPQEEDLFFFAVFFLPVFSVFFLADDFFFVATAFLARALGRLRNAARWAAAKAALAQSLNSSESSNSRAGNSQYELTVTVFARVWY